MSISTHAGKQPALHAGPCGVVCTQCGYYARGLCGGCVRKKPARPRNSGAARCPIVRCADARNVNDCGHDCPDFPCLLFDRWFPHCWPQVDPEPNARDVSQPESSAGAIPAMPRTEDPSTDVGLRIWCLGSFKVFRGSQEILETGWGQDKGPSRKIKAMFAYLLSSRERGARKETLIDLLWPDQADGERSDSTFHQALYFLRRALEPDLESGAASSYIRYQNGRYSFHSLAPHWIDVDLFGAHCHRALQCAQKGAADAATRYWRTAVELYGGDYMAGIDVEYTENTFHNWCMPRRYRLRELYLTALLETARHYRHLGAPDTGLDYARQALDADPAFEAAHRVAMQCLVESGRPDQAIRQYHECQAQLAWYDNRPPTALTQRVYEDLVKPPDPDD